MKEKEYIRLPIAKPLLDSRSELRKLSDEEWKNLIFHHLLRFYKEADLKKIKTRIQDEKRKKRSNIEEVIKKEIKKWLKNDRLFDTQDFIINREPSADGNVAGFYDLKFEHSQWKHKYFPFECKNLDRNAASINEYVYNKTKKDGGVYRYLTGKYAPELDFGGMIGFILDGNENEIISKIIVKISGTFQDHSIKKSSIEGNRNTFDSIHLKRPKECRTGQTFILHHIIFDMN